MLPNATPLAILASYMVTAVALTVCCIRVIRGHPPQASRPSVSSFTVFTTLSVLSLATTWSYMFAYFRWSYLDWAANSSPVADANQPRLGEWLRDTSLFKQAWFSALETPARAWWTLQIFGFCAIWSVMLSVQARKRNIAHIWVFMLLGQIVAISFATNLFFLAVLVHDAGANKKMPSNMRKLRARSSDTVILLAHLAITILLLGNLDGSYFMYLLLAPHVLAFAPILRDRLLHSGTPPHQLREPSKLLQLGILAALISMGTSRAFNQGADWRVILKTLHEHPAVSSVGWDVICCWLSHTVWTLLGDSD
ncbi:hypothetical protein MMYC01_207883 [Madurella mycetomatis]|uniref:Uncharacterized protein n=1 Tax=Madurella mycetomatis TaxID=100816 RepID=A0A175VYZ3_9PEZI|nr:hypothetical protein MMYC01_209483 [Madurella mycetomatis]KXX76220.1 hypothetical protein MMYC01_207883 [Madurella mycetomatis]